MPEYYPLPRTPPIPSLAHVNHPPMTRPPTPPWWNATEAAKQHKYHHYSILGVNNTQMPGTKELLGRVTALPHYRTSSYRSKLG